MLKERETDKDELDPRSPSGDVEMRDRDKPHKSSKSGQKNAHGLDKRQIEQRIEEDRERHKRQRESIWAIPKTRNAELNKLWEETSDLGEDDDRLIDEEAEEFSKEMAVQQCPHKRAANGDKH